MKEEIKKIIANELLISVDKVADTSRLDALGADSLNIASIMMDLERTLHVTIPVSMDSKIKTVGQLVDFVNSLTPNNK